MTAAVKPPRSLASRLLRIALALLALAVLGVLAFIWFGPVTVGDKRVLLDFMLGRSIAPPSAQTVATQLRVAPGYRLQVFADDVPLARVLRVTDAGDLILSRTRAGEVLLLERDGDGDGRSDGRRVLLQGLDRPHGLELHDGWLYVAETTAIGRVRFDSATRTIAGPYVRIVQGLTGDGFHLTRTIRIGPDGLLYLSQGSSCNACIERDTRRATIMRFAPDGSGATMYATGLRNSVDFDWAPWDGSLYATENSRDLLGDDTPADELNRIVAGGFYGWPFVHGEGVVDPELGAAHASEIAQALAPAHAFRAHNAPLGIEFLRATGRPPGYERAAVVALHGSWNRSTPDGYKLVSLHWRENGDIEERDFLTGFLSDEGILGRPAFVAEGPDGAVYVSDDYAGVIYRIAADRARTDAGAGAGT